MLSVKWNNHRWDLWVGNTLSSSSDRMMEWLRLEEAFADHFFQPPAQVASARAGCPGHCLPGFIVSLKSGDSTRSLGNLLQCFVTLVVKVFFLHLNWIFCISVYAHCLCAFAKLTVTLLFGNQPYWKDAEHQPDKDILTGVVSKPWSVSRSQEVVSKLISLKWVDFVSRYVLAHTFMSILH